MSTNKVYPLYYTLCQKINTDGVDRGEIEKQLSKKISSLDAKYHEAIMLLIVEHYLHTGCENRENFISSLKTPSSIVLPYNGALSEKSTETSWNLECLPIELLIIIQKFVNGSFPLNDEKK
jgi:hypothetical protein